MSKYLRITSFMLVLFVMISAISYSGFWEYRAFAADSTGYVNGEIVRMRKSPTTSSDIITSLTKEYVTIHNSVTGTQAVSGKGTTWYYATTLDGKYSGYLYGYYVTISQSVSTEFEAQLQYFPESYRASLKALKSMYPNWVFIADKVSMKFDDAVDAEYKDLFRKEVELTYDGGNTAWRDSRLLSNGVWKTDNGSNWTGASRGAIAYFMDPRNFLNANNVYMFLQQKYDSTTQNADGVRRIIKGTFLEKGYGGNADAYLNDIMAAAKETEVSPYILAAAIIVEQGSNGTSGLISGNYSGYQGYYNFFNIGASGTTTSAVISSGLNYAKSKGWDTRTKSIVGGAQFYNDGYISDNQDTYYYEDFNVKNAVWWHQYAQSVYDAYVKANRVVSVYSGNANATLVFKIPVFTSIPETVSPKPTAVNPPITTPIVPPTPVTPPTPVAPPAPVYSQGDIDGDSKIGVTDLSMVKKHILTIKTLTGESLSRADVNRDGKVNVVDLSAVKKDILGIKKIS